MPQIRALLSRRVEDLAARKRLYLWAEHGRKHEHVGSGAKPAVCFWHSTHGSRKLPDVAVDGLLSAVLVGQLKPMLYTFGEFDNVPCGVEVRKAGDVMLRGEFNIMQKKVSSCRSFPTSFVYAFCASHRQIMLGSGTLTL